MQVRTYSKVFWKRYKELGEDQGEKYIKQIERGEQRIQRQQDIMDAIAAKMDRYRNPWQVRKGSIIYCAWWPLSVEAKLVFLYPTRTRAQLVLKPSVSLGPTEAQQTNLCSCKLIKTKLKWCS